MDLNFLKGKKVLVAGGAGLLGSALTDLLDREGIEVEATCFSRPPVPRLAHRYTRYDLTSPEQCLAATKGKDLVLICAAHSGGVQQTRNSPTAGILPNLAICAGLFEACSTNAVERALWISSSTVYQDAPHPIREDELDLNLPVHPVYDGVGDLYRYLEGLAGCHRRRRGLAISTVRTANIYGPFDRFADGRSHVIPALIKRALSGETPFTVWGDGATTRDFVYVDDLVAGLLELARHPEEAGPINFSSGRGVTVAELVETVLAACGHRAPVRFDPSQPTAIPYRVLDNTRFRERFGKLPTTPLAEGIARTVAWYRSELSRD
jgi:nucleoside-diphosphate-sugar epimerase